jgi:hypothetical protein
MKGTPWSRKKATGYTITAVFGVIGENSGGKQWFPGKRTAGLSVLE